MQDLKDLECLVALSRYRHFARAAEACGLSQPAFSMRIRGLEDRLGTRIVRRGNRFEGLTREGEQVLAHAKTIIGEIRALEAEVMASRGQIVGTLSFGVIPTASVFAAGLARRLHARHPRIATTIVSANSLAVQQGVEDGRFDLGITYGEGAAADLLRLRPLYDERYSLLMPEAIAPEGAAAISWAEAATLPLILLEPSMQNRRIIDRVFRDLGLVPKVISETNGFLPAVTMAGQGMGATVIPEKLEHGLGRLDGVRVLPLTEPEIAKSISLVTSRREAAVPALLALLDLLSEDTAS